MDKIKGFEARVSSAIVVISLLLPSILEPEWLWRLTCILATCVIGVYVSLSFYYQWLIKKRKYYEITAQSDAQIKKMNPGQKKWHFYLFYFGVLVGCPFFLYVSSLPVIDVISISSGRSEVKTEILTLESNNTSMGASIVGQILGFRNQNDTEQDLYLLYSLRIQRVNKVYKVTYLPYSNLVLEIKPIGN